MPVDAFPKVAQAVERAVLRSFVTRPMRGITASEARRRVQICERIWKELRVVKGWSVNRACDYIYRYLISELDGVSWEPDHRAIWVPDSSPNKGDVP